MGEKKLNYSLLLGDFKNFSGDINDIYRAHNKLNELRDLFINDEPHVTIDNEFQKIHLPFEVGKSISDSFSELTKMDKSLMFLKQSLDIKSKRTEYIKENTAGFADLSYLVGDGKVNIESIDLNQINAAGQEVRKLRNLLWVGDMDEFNKKARGDSISFAPELTPCLFDLIDLMQLRNREVRMVKVNRDRFKSGERIYRNGQNGGLFTPDAIGRAFFGDVITTSFPKYDPRTYQQE